MELNKKQEYLLVGGMTLGLIAGFLMPLIGLIILGSMGSYAFKSTNNLPKEQKTMMIMAFVVIVLYYLLTIIFNVMNPPVVEDPSTVSQLLIFI
ncbi:MAG: hypothetical protein RBS24_01255 [Bacilli bacterium]|jgi:uncharacterized membrane protein|nr:hypothetical protein [Bacilli bacterium]